MTLVVSVYIYHRLYRRCFYARRRVEVHTSVFASSLWREFLQCLVFFLLLLLLLLINICTAVAPVCEDIKTQNCFRIHVWRLSPGGSCAIEFLASPKILNSFWADWTLQAFQGPSPLNWVLMTKLCACSLSLLLLAAHICSWYYCSTSRS